MRRSPARVRVLQPEKASTAMPAPWSRRGSQSSQLGRYQFQSPSSFIVDGSSTARTIVASIRTAVASPTPICFKKRIESVAKIANTLTITMAALVTTPAVVLIPCPIASSVVGPGRMPRGSGS